MKHSFIYSSIFIFSISCGGSRFAPNISDAGEFSDAGNIQDDGGVDANYDAGISDANDAAYAIDATPELLSCKVITGKYLFTNKIIFDDCNNDAGADDAGVNDSGADADALDASLNIDAGGTSLETFVSGFTSSNKFSNCATILDQIDINYCSGTSHIECADASMLYDLYSRYYIKDINANNFSVFSDVEYSNTEFHTGICHKSFITNYYRQL